MLRESLSIRVVLATGLLSSSAAAQSTELVSASLGGGQANFNSFTGSLSADGRFVAFSSYATNLVPIDANSQADIFVRDRLSGTTELVSLDSSGAQAIGYCDVPVISADGRFVAFRSGASNLVAGDTNHQADIFVRDRLNGTTELVSLGSGGVQANDISMAPAISADGRFVAFWSGATNLVAGDGNQAYDTFVHDRQNGTTERVSLDSTGLQANGQSTNASISGDGRFVAFVSSATNLVAGDTNGSQDIFVRDRQNGTTERVNLDSAGAQGNFNCWAPSISADGRFVAFESVATNLVAGDTNATGDIFVRDRQNATTELVSVDSFGAQGNEFCMAPSISADGRFVVFWTLASNLVAADTNSYADVFVRDRLSTTTRRVSVNYGGGDGDSDSEVPSISADGRFVVFRSYASNLVQNDTNGLIDIFVRDVGTPTPGLDVCQPGIAGVSACPCSNPPPDVPRGCENSSATGGAQLTSSGTASLTVDSVVFATNGERPSTTSIVLQGNAGLANGVAFGQGVRCAGGTLKRLYTKVASGGSITAPGLGDPSVSARSATLGDVIVAPTSRWYAVYYRDPIVLGGCAASSTFNITQTQLVVWGS